jgi:hypothetical protein
MSDTEDAIIEEANPFGEEIMIEHTSTCWLEHGKCATKKLQELLLLLNMSKKKIDRDELIKILTG